MHYNKEKLKKIAKTLSTFMTTTKDVAVTISGSRAYRTPGCINIPEGDFTNPDIVKMSLGFIHHELGHEKHTDSNVFVAANKKSPTHKKFLNSLEDCRMESEVVDEFRGSIRTLGETVRLAKKYGLFGEPSEEATPMQLFQGLLLYHGRSHCLSQDVKEFAEKARSILDQKVGSALVNQVVDLIEKTPTSTSTQDVYEIACAIYDLLDEEDKNDDQDDQSDESETSDNSNDQDDSNSSDENETEENDDSSGDSEDNTEDDQNSEDSGNSNEDEANDGDPSNQSDDDSNGSEGEADSDTSEDAKAFIKKILNAEESDGDEDFHEQLAELLGQEAQNHQVQETSSGTGGYPMPDMTICRQPILDGTIADGAINSTAHKIYLALNRVLMDEVQQPLIHRRVGRNMDTSLIAEMASGRENVFLMDEDEKDLSAAVSFLVDGSGSMGLSTQDGLTRMEITNACVLAFCKALSKASIVNEVIYYCIQDTVLEWDDTLYRAKSFDEKHTKKAKFNVSAYGGTLTGQAMISAIYSLIARDEQNKMLFVLTDGDAADVGRILEAKRLANLFGIKIIPIGICTSRVAGFTEDEFKPVFDLTDLPHAVKHAIKAKLFK